MPFEGLVDIAPQLGIKTSSQTRKMLIIKTTASIPATFCTNVKTVKYSSFEVQIREQQIQDGAQPPF